MHVDRKKYWKIIAKRRLHLSPKIFQASKETTFSILFKKNKSLPLGRKEEEGGREKSNSYGG